MRDKKRSSVVEGRYIARECSCERLSERANLAHLYFDLLVEIYLRVARHQVASRHAFRDLDNRIKHGAPPLVLRFARNHGVGNICCRQIDYEASSVGFDHDVTLAPADLRNNIVAARLRGGSFHRLVVNHSSGRTRLPTSTLSVDHQCHVVDRLEQKRRMKPRNQQ